MKRMFGILMMVGAVGFVGCGGDKDSSTEPCVVSMENRQFFNDLTIS